MFEGSDTDPTEEYLNHGAGNGGYGGASYIDDVVFLDRDTDANGSLDERIWYAQNWRHDVVAIVDDSGHQLEMARYSSYGVPFGLPGGDADSDGDNDSADHSQILTWGTSGPYDVRGDMDLDGDIDNSDKSTAEGAPFNGSTLGRGVLTADAVGNRGGYGGCAFDSTRTAYHVRERNFHTNLGRWQRRDRLGYVDGMSLYECCGCNPVAYNDPFGLLRWTHCRTLLDAGCSDAKRTCLWIGELDNQYPSAFRWRMFPGILGIMLQENYVQLRRSGCPPVHSPGVRFRWFEFQIILASNPTYSDALGLKKGTGPETFGNWHQDAQNSFFSVRNPMFSELLEILGDYGGEGPAVGKGLRIETGINPWTDYDLSRFFGHGDEETGLYGGRSVDLEWECCSKEITQTVLEALQTTS